MHILQIEHSMHRWDANFSFATSLTLFAKFAFNVNEHRPYKLEVELDVELDVQVVAILLMYFALIVI